MRRATRGALAAALALLALACGCGGGSPHPDSTRVPPPWVPVARPADPSNPWVIAGEAASAGLPHTHPNVLFVGDSITQWWQYYGSAVWNADFIPLGAVDDGVAGDTTNNVIYRLQSGSLTGISPPVVVVMIGTNNIPLGQSAAQIVEGIAAVVRILHAHLPSSRILLLDVLPRDEPGSHDRRVADQIDRVLASGPPPGVNEYLDVGRGLLQPSGHFRPGVMFADLLHPTGSGYQIMAATLLPAVVGLLHATR